MATTSHDTVVTRRAMDHRLHDLVADLPRQKWKRRSCGEGSHGLRIYDWARAEVRPFHRPDRKHWVLARRSITDPTKIIEAAITDGDTVVVRRQPVAENGDIIAAMIDGEATVKRLKREHGQIWLMPHNPT